MSQGAWSSEFFHFLKFSPNMLERLIAACFSFCPHSSVRDLLHHMTYAADSLARTTHLDKVKATAVQEVHIIINKVSMFYGFLQLYSSNALVSNALSMMKLTRDTFSSEFLNQPFTGEFGIHSGRSQQKQWNTTRSQFKERIQASLRELARRQQHPDSSKQCKRNLLNMRHFTDILFYSFYF